MRERPRQQGILSVPRSSGTVSSEMQPAKTRHAQQNACPSHDVHDCTSCCLSLLWCCLRCREFVFERGQTQHQATNQNVFCRCCNSNAVLRLVEEFNGGHPRRVNLVCCGLKEVTMTTKPTAAIAKPRLRRRFPSAVARWPSADSPKSPEDPATKGQHGREDVGVDVLIHVIMADQDRC